MLIQAKKVPLPWACQLRLCSLHAEARVNGLAPSNVRENTTELAPFPVPPGPLLLRTAEIELVAKLAANIPRTWANYWKDSGEGQEVVACAANGRDTAVGRKTSAPAAGNGRKTAVGLSGTGRHREGGSRTIAGPEQESETGE